MAGVEWSRGKKRGKESERTAGGQLMQGSVTNNKDHTSYSVCDGEPFKKF